MDNRIIGQRKVRFSRDDIATFNAQWPCSTLRDSRAYWFQFDERGDLVDCDVPEQDDGQAALALADDAKRILDGEVVGWLKT